MNNVRGQVLHRNILRRRGAFHGRSHPVLHESSGRSGGRSLLVSCVGELAFRLGDGAATKGRRAVSIHPAMTVWALAGVGAGGWEDLGCGKGLETPFSLLGGGHAAGEFGDFAEEGVVLLAPVDDGFVAHVSHFPGRVRRLP